jgi:hypothetical protein
VLDILRDQAWQGVGALASLASLLIVIHLERVRLRTKLILIIQVFVGLALGLLAIVGGNTLLGLSLATPSDRYSGKLRP